MAARYFELRDANILTKEYIMEEFFYFKDQIPEETWEKEAYRWCVASDGSYVVIPGYDYTQIDHYLNVAVARMDEKYTNMLGVITGTSVAHNSAKVGVTYFYKIRAISSVSSANSAYSTVRSVTVE